MRRSCAEAVNRRTPLERPAGLGEPLARAEAGRGGAMSPVGGFDPLIGRTFRGYRIERLIASGGMGSVYLAREESLRNVLKVVKVLLAEEWDPRTREALLDRFEREAFAVSVLRHDNIAGIHAYGHLEDGQPCMVMDYVEGKTLHQLASAQGRVSPYRVMHYMCHVARGLDFAHAQGIVHRDLKPDNIMLAPKDWDAHFCVLLDFGMAKITQSMLGNKPATMSGVGLGTPSYMAVEQFRNADEATAQSDIYSLAIIVWYLTTGELPWGPCDGASPLGRADLYDRQRTKLPSTPPPGLMPPGWEQACRQALTPDPHERHASVRHFMVDLANGLEANGPHVKSGAQILESICPKFIATSGPEAETVRQAHARTILEAAWPRLEAPIRPAVADIRTRPDLPRNVQPGQRTPVMSVAPTSTLGAATGALLAQPTTRRFGRRRLAFLCLAAASALLAAGLAMLSGRKPQNVGGPAQRGAQSSRSNYVPDAQTIEETRAPATRTPGAAARAVPAPDIAAPAVAPHATFPQAPVTTTTPATTTATTTTTPLAKAAITTVAAPVQPAKPTSANKLLLRDAAEMKHDSNAPDFRKHVDHTPSSKVEPEFDPNALLGQ